MILVVIMSPTAVCASLSSWGICARLLLWFSTLHRVVGRYSAGLLVVYYMFDATEVPAI